MVKLCMVVIRGYGQFATRTLRYGHFATGHFATWTLLHGQNPAANRGILKYSRIRLLRSITYHPGKQKVRTKLLTKSYYIQNPIPKVIIGKQGRY